MAASSEDKARREAWRLFIVANIGILVSCVVMVWATGMLGGDVPVGDFIVIALGLVVVSVVGSGLMTLVFYSSRTTDEAPPIYELAEDRKPGKGQR